MAPRAPAAPLSPRLLLAAWALLAAWQGTEALLVLGRASAGAGLDERWQALTLGRAERTERALGELLPMVRAVGEHVPPGASVAICARVARDGSRLTPRELEARYRQRLVSLLVPRPVLLLVLDEGGLAPPMTVPADVGPFVAGGLHVLELGSAGPFPGRSSARLLAEGAGFRLWFAPDLVEDP